MRTRSEPMPTLLNRQHEPTALDDLLGALRAGRGRALVVRGEAGVGKSALLEYVVGAAADMRVARAPRAWSPGSARVPARVFTGAAVGALRVVPGATLEGIV